MLYSPFTHGCREGIRRHREVFLRHWSLQQRPLLLGIPRDTGQRLKTQFRRATISSGSASHLRGTLLVDAYVTLCHHTCADVKVLDQLKHALSIAHSHHPMFDFEVEVVQAADGHDSRVLAEMTIDVVSLDDVIPSGFDGRVLCH